MRKALLLLVFGAAALADDAQTAFDALKKEYETAVQEFLRPAREAQEKGGEASLDWSKYPSVAFMPRFLAFAKGHPKTDAAAEALVLVVQSTRAEADRTDAVGILLRDHRDAAAMKGVLYHLQPADLRGLAEKSPHADVRGHALLRLADIGAEAGEEAAAIALYRQVKEKYADVPSWEGTLGARADGGIFEIEHLGIGKTAPEIEGEDLDGKPMKLSDFKGKVVVLDFWGDW
ncbi:MAG TPA: hypothetical protein VFY93_00345 [Planctomycetota bacterium]|nr:hypothetical protein [Planctomycetota bacterium]